jgi:hypothetical protein
MSAAPWEAIKDVETWQDAYAGINLFLLTSFARSLFYYEPPAEHEYLKTWDKLDPKYAEQKELLRAVTVRQRMQGVILQEEIMGPFFVEEGDEGLKPFREINAKPEDVLAWVERHRQPGKILSFLTTTMNVIAEKVFNYAYANVTNMPEEACKAFFQLDHVNASGESMMLQQRIIPQITCALAMEYDHFQGSEPQGAYDLRGGLHFTHTEATTLHDVYKFRLIFFQLIAQKRVEALREFMPRPKGPNPPKPQDWKGEEPSIHNVSNMPLTEEQMQPYAQHELEASQLLCRPLPLDDDHATEEPAKKEHRTE